AGWVSWASAAARCSCSPRCSTVTRRMTWRRAVTTRPIRRRGCRRARLPRPQSRPGSAGRSNAADRLSLTNPALPVVPRETATQKEPGDGELRAPTRLVVLEGESESAQGAREGTRFGRRAGASVHARRATARREKQPREALGLDRSTGTGEPATNSIIRVIGPA